MCERQVGQIDSTEQQFDAENLNRLDVFCLNAERRDLWEGHVVIRISEGCLSWLPKRDD
jgi:hypothetical protein